jgi:hypothetical protein
VFPLFQQKMQTMDKTLSLPTLVFLIWLGALVTVLMRFS